MPSENQTTARIAKHNVDTLMLCGAGAWLYGSISHGRARELAKVLGRTTDEIEGLKYTEELQKERERHGAE